MIKDRKQQSRKTADENIPVTRYGFLSVKVRKTILFYFKIAIAALALYLLSLKIDIQQIVQFVGQIPLSLILTCFIIELFRIFLVSQRWKNLSYVPSHFSSFDYFRFSLISIMSNLIMPGALGGDGVKTAIVLSKVKEKAAHSLTILFDRTIGLFSVTLLPFFSLIFFHLEKGKNVYLWVSLCSAAFFLFIMFVILSDLPYKIFFYFIKKWKSLKNIFDQLKKGTIYYKGKPMLIIKSVILSLIIHLISVSICFLFSESLEINCPFTTFMIIVPLVWIITAIPLSFGGLGIREWSFVGLLSYQAVEPEKAVTLSLVLFSLTIFTGFSAIPLFY